MSSILTIKEIQSEALKILEDAFKPKPTRSLAFDTGEAIYEAHEYPTGWTIQRDGGNGVRITLVENQTEEDMWLLLKLLK